MIMVKREEKKVMARFGSKPLMSEKYGDENFYGRAKIRRQRERSQGDWGYYSRE